MVGLFYIYLPMSWQIPTQIEQDIIAGKAKYQTFQTGNGGQSILPVPSNSYVVIFGYDYSPAGNGIRWTRTVNAVDANAQVEGVIRYFGTQQISFYTGNDFFPFIHGVNIVSTLVLKTWDAALPDNNQALTYTAVEEVDNAPIARQVYITSTNDVTITVGGISSAIRATANAIPITNRTPQGLTYGGSVQVPNTQTNYGPGGTPQQFIQPSPKDYQDFAFGLLPANADRQAFATPDINNGLRDFSEHLNNAFGIASNANPQYYLCLHYAIYSKTIPEQRG
jgi:hypothetical protein